MLDKIKIKNKWYYPIIFLFVLHYLYIVSDNPLEPEPLTEYRIVYLSHENSGGDGWSEGCAGSTEGYYWYGQVKEDGIFSDTWKFNGKCGDTEEDARKITEEDLKKQLESRKSMGNIYQAWITKEDTVTFTKDGSK